VNGEQTIPPLKRLLVERNGLVVKVSLNRPEARNAIDLTFCQEIKSTFEAIDAEPDIAVVQLGAVGPVFCAGADLKERQGRDPVLMLRRL
jgi:enoyl-CoA hydratase/carnithine racemase